LAAFGPTMLGFVWCEYPNVSLRRLAVSPDGDLLFYKRQKK
jgi:hypothetical protein